MSAVPKVVATDGQRDKGRTRQLSGWKAALQGLVDEHAGRRVNGKPASFRTRELAATTLFSVFNTLHSIGFKIEKPANFKNEHVAALVMHWHHKGHTPGTIQTTLSVLRKFCGWIGKSGMIQPLPYYLKDIPATQLKRTATIVTSKSWTEAGIDVDRKIAQADALDMRFGLMLRTAVAFDLRARELIMLRPWKSDHGDYLAVFAGTKTGRARVIPITNEYQREVLELLKERITKAGALGWTHTRRGKRANLQYQEDEYQRRMQEIGITKKLAGVTGHGLRAECAENASMERGLIPPTLGGTADQMPREDIDLIRSQVSEMLGHSRLSVTNSYYGSFGRFRTKPEQRVANPNLAPGRATPSPVKSAKVSESGIAKGAPEAGVKGLRKRKVDEVDVRQMLQDGIWMLKKKPK